MSKLAGCFYCHEYFPREEMKLAFIKFKNFQFIGHEPMCVDCVKIFFPNKGGENLVNRYFRNYMPYTVESVWKYEGE